MSDLGDRIMKVNHAGEHGAIAIYSGQILMARLTCPDLIAALAEFRSHEQRHRSIFGAELRRRNIPRCRSYWLCGIGGYTLGAITGLFGRSAIAATTVAVESVVLRHLEEQIDRLGGGDPDAVAAILSIAEEERQHRDHSAADLKARGFWPKILMPVVSVSTETVIWLGLKM